MELSVYSGAHEPGVDYDTLDPIYSATVRLNDDNDDRWPTIDGPHTGIGRGYFEAQETGEYVFSWGYGASSYASVILGGEEVYRRDVGDSVSKREPFTVTEGQRYEFQVTYFTSASPGAWTSQIGLPGTLETLVHEDGKFPHLLDDNGAWVTRDDVWYKGVIAATADQALSVGLGANPGLIGPEFQFGHVMGDFHDEKVIIVKASQGNRSLGWDLLPPGSERFTVQGQTYAGYRDPDDVWPDGEEPTPVEGWYAGKQYDDFVTALHSILDDCPATFQDFSPAGCEIAGFAYFQGHKDTGNPVHADRYDVNLANFIRAIRTEFGAEAAPFAVATIGFQPMTGNTLTVAEAQLAVDGEGGDYPEFAGNVMTVDTRDSWRDTSLSPMNQGYHYNRNAETFMLVGDALGQAMVKMLGGADEEGTP